MKSIKMKILIAVVAVVLITGVAVFAASIGIGQTGQSAKAELMQNGTVTEIYNGASPAVVEIIVKENSGFRRCIRGRTGFRFCH